VGAAQRSYLEHLLPLEGLTPLVETWRLRFCSGAHYQGVGASRNLVSRPRIRVVEKRPRFGDTNAPTEDHQLPPRLTNPLWLPPGRGLLKTPNFGSAAPSTASSLKYIELYPPIVRRCLPSPVLKSGLPWLFRSTDYPAGLPFFSIDFTPGCLKDAPGRKVSFFFFFLYVSFSVFSKGGLNIQKFYAMAAPPGFRSSHRPSCPRRAFGKHRLEVLASRLPKACHRFSVRARQAVSIVLPPR